MVSFEIFLLGLLITSTITGLATEAVKTILVEHKIKYRANTLVGIIAMIVSAGIGIAYVVVTGMSITAQVIVCLIAQIFMSWLCALVGYDKVIQAISQFKTNKKED